MRSSTARKALVVLVMAAAVVTACAAPQRAPSRPGQPADETTPRYGAPAVERPLDVSRIFSDPCGATLTVPELRQFDIHDEGRPRSYLGDSECSWSSRAGDVLSLGVDNNRDSLVDTYRSPHLPVFVPTKVGGYPSVRQKTNDKYNACTVTTGLGQRRALQADWTGLAPASPGVDPCQRAEDAIALVIRKLPPQK
ncbi:DUF3558 domain-containing protein [Actinomycetospora endophytica]|uniref:DUF3558 domain-containing protein n=1 Tax=Actinomycetospora endophytica TaxID=2291215 RepID=A0ABS8P5P4_9PSEU|nr:DUF3558 domain-containing protein [Actinomycetospora endophytica]MCD2193576.1 DUF3558 domain-containing protein [Actinomycetospora endophytica]